jgi:hypothetical protein
MKGTGDPEEPVDAHQRIEKHIDTLFRAFEAYENEHPHWQSESLLWIMEW